KTRLGGITKRGNRYLRRLLINGASANLLRSKATKADPWVIGLRRRRPPLVVAVALANKTARIAWAVMLREKVYQPRAMGAWAPTALGLELAREQWRVIARSVDPTQPREACRFIGTSIPLE